MRDSSLLALPNMLGSGQWHFQARKLDLSKVGGQPKATQVLPPESPDCSSRCPKPLFDIFYKLVQCGV